MLFLSWRNSLGRRNEGCAGSARIGAGCGAVVTEPSLLCCCRGRCILQSYGVLLASSVSVNGSPQVRSRCVTIIVSEFKWEGLKPAVASRLGVTVTTRYHTSVMLSHHPGDWPAANRRHRRCRGAIISSSHPFRPYPQVRDIESIDTGHTSNNPAGALLVGAQSDFLGPRCPYSPGSGVCSVCSLAVFVLPHAVVTRLEPGSSTWLSKAPCVSLLLCSAPELQL